MENMYSNSTENLSTLLRKAKPAKNEHLLTQKPPSLENKETIKLNVLESIVYGDYPDLNQLTPKMVPFMEKAFTSDPNNTPTKEAKKVRAYIQNTVFSLVRDIFSNDEANEVGKQVVKMVFKQILSDNVDDYANIEIMMTNVKSAAISGDPDKQQLVTGFLNEILSSEITPSALKIDAIKILTNPEHPELLSQEVLACLKTAFEHPTTEQAGSPPWRYEDAIKNGAYDIAQAANTKASPLPLESQVLGIVKQYAPEEI